MGSAGGTLMCLLLTYWQFWSPGKVSLRKLNWSDFVVAMAISFFYRLWHLSSSGRSWDKSWASLANSTGASHCLSSHPEAVVLYHYLYFSVKSWGFWGIGQSRTQVRVWDGDKTRGWRNQGGTCQQSLTSHLVAKSAPGIQIFLHFSKKQSSPPLSSIAILCLLIFQSSPPNTTSSEIFWITLYKLMFLPTSYFLLDVHHYFLQWALNQLFEA